MIAGGSWLVQRVVEASQFEALSDCSKGILNRTRFDLFAATEVSLSGPFTKGLDDGNFFIWM